MTTEIEQIKKFDLSEVSGEITNLGKQILDSVKGGSGYATVSFSNNIMRRQIDGSSKSATLPQDIVLVGVSSASTQRVFYLGEFNPDSKSAPTCASSDGVVPNKDAQQPQAAKCADCPNNQPGSGGKGNKKACRYNRKIAVLLTKDFKTALAGKVHRATLPITSLIGTGEGGRKPFNEYLKELRANKVSPDRVITRVYTDEREDKKAVLFEAVRATTPEEQAVIDKVDAAEVASLVF
jgi:hypothetical protein